MKIYTVTFLENNYGSILQAFALQKKLREFGADPIILLRDNNETSLLKNVKKLLRFMKPLKHYSLVMRFKTQNLQFKYKKKHSKLNDFIRENISTMYIKDTDIFVKQLSYDDILLAGSDQIWSMINGKLSDWYTFNWHGIPSSVKKASYAASIGLSELTNEQKDEYYNKLHNYQSISFREEQARESLLNIFQCPVRSDLDPTLLYDGNFWGGLASERLVNVPYVFVYMLRPDTRLINMAKDIAIKNNCKIIYTGLLPDKFKDVETIYDAGINEFLSYIKYADYVITNSFHGTVFSLVFKRQFVNVEIASTSSRAKNLLRIAHVEDRMIKDEKALEILERPINYEIVSTFIDEKRQKSIEYIKYICRMND